MKEKNYFNLRFKSCNENISLARNIVGAFVMKFNPLMSELNDIKTAVSEAVTNSIIHGYNEDTSKEVEIHCENNDKKVIITITDTGKGIDDIDKARMPLYTTGDEFERSGMGFTVMEAIMDKISVISKGDEGTTVILEKDLNRPER